jgi:hypothetical protein
LECARPPTAPLRRWRLIEVGPGPTLTLSPLRIDERILHYRAGVDTCDERLTGMIAFAPATGDLTPSQQAVAHRIAGLWSSADAASVSVVQLCGPATGGTREIAAAVCAQLGLALGVLPVRAISRRAGELDTLIRLWTREAVLSECALLVDCEDIDRSDADREAAVARLVEETGGVLFLATPQRRPLGPRPTVAFDVKGPTREEQLTLWQRTLGSAGNRLNGTIEAVVSQFALGPDQIHAVCAAAATAAHLVPDAPSPASSAEPAHDLAKRVWQQCRLQARPRIDALAQRIDPAARWDDLVLPGPQKQVLQEVAIHLRHRSKVYDAWGFTAKGARGLGISALLAGPSGTGKTMAAEVLAIELKLDLYRIDLSSVVSKYIGETEKNLRRVFDAAEDSGAMLLFDEADALFGKRSEVKDSHDRYANIEVSYLLQRMEAYRGLAILTTNRRDALDAAFLRRICFIVQFPFPDAAARAEIWQRVFPNQTPTEGLDIAQLAKLNVAGGNIRNIALNAAFLAADRSRSVTMGHLLLAARSEYAKLEQPLNEVETGDWR